MHIQCFETTKENDARAVDVDVGKASFNQPPLSDSHYGNSKEREFRTFLIMGKYERDSQCT
ncbi:hypothetical protein ACODM8_13055 [Vibrio ostreicida]|uniref:Uncharacterized protein n=1 Tax=Vibrio ostreicida TaxID=526588 RepID=A0ABT8C058_9VIBR|nr:hypothetical protein [Vibrio ostreicida]MDN3611725.1 hypothetical protein [Vibrio ostreicida]NPD09540.1 hypothetical protein [Vibrio ostreicida]